MLEDLNLRPRKELQALAKKYGVKANGKTIDIIARIQKAAGVDQQPSEDAENCGDEGNLQQSFQAMDLGSSKGSKPNSPFKFTPVKGSKGSSKAEPNSSGSGSPSLKSRLFPLSRAFRSSPKSTASRTKKATMGTTVGPPSGLKAPSATRFPASRGGSSSGAAVGTEADEPHHDLNTSSSSLEQKGSPTSGMAEEELIAERVRVVVNVIRALRHGPSGSTFDQILQFLILNPGKYFESRCAAVQLKRAMLVATNDKVVESHLGDDGKLVRFKLPSKREGALYRVNYAHGLHAGSPVPGLKEPHAEKNDAPNALPGSTGLPGSRESRIPLPSSKDRAVKSAGASRNDSGDGNRGRQHQKQSIADAKEVRAKLKAAVKAERIRRNEFREQLDLRGITKELHCSSQSAMEMLDRLSLKFQCAHCDRNQQPAVSSSPVAPAGSSAVAPTASNEYASQRRIPPSSSSSGGQLEQQLQCLKLRDEGSPADLDSSRMSQDEDIWRERRLDRQRRNREAASGLVTPNPSRVTRRAPALAVPATPAINEVDTSAIADTSADISRAAWAAAAREAEEQQEIANLTAELTEASEMVQSQEKEDEESIIDEAWIVKESRSKPGKYYFYNSRTRET